MRFGLCPYLLLVYQFLQIHADQICYYTNQSVIVTINCLESCCSGMAFSAEAACCSTISWMFIAIPTFVAVGICFLIVCFIYCQPLLKLCLPGCKCPRINRSRASQINPTSVTANPVYTMNTDDLPNYNTIVKDSTPPTYNFVAAHPNEFGIEESSPTAPPQYRSRNNSVATTAPTSSPPSLQSRY